MERGQNDDCRAESRRPVVIIGITAFAGLVAVWIACRRPAETGALRSERTGSPTATAVPPPIDFDSPFRNTRPGVAYVGDSACARCHAAIASRYHQHPMARSISSIADWVKGPAATGAAAVAVESNGCEYRIEEADGRVVHKEIRRDAQRRVIVERAAEVAFAIGSGTRGTSFVIDEGGYFFESPLTWYGQKKSWHLSPGYERQNQHFERMVQGECLYCHANPVEPFPDAANRFRGSVASIRAIGCERCHGPGGLHVRERAIVDGKDLTIVNPKHLDPARRDAVCQQCHLKGDNRILHAGLQANDFRPGLPLHRVWSVFFQPEHVDGQLEVVSHVEQMALSRCYQASDGRMGCTSCHDPHEVPAPAHAAAYYRDRCLECHAPNACQVGLTEPRAGAAAGDCVACHMPRARAADIIHVAATDHRILRRQDEAPARSDAIATRNVPLLDFHHRQIESESQRLDVRRDLGVALGSRAWLYRNTPDGAALARQAMSYIVPALRRRPTDIVARETKGLSLWLEGRTDEALAEFETVLRSAPERENTLVSTAALLAELGRTDEAIARWRQALAANPWLSSRQFALAQLLARRRDWKEAATHCREALRLDPTSADPRRLLIECLLESGATRDARDEFQVLLALEPANRDRLVRWFAEQSGGTTAKP